MGLCGLCGVVSIRFKAISRRATVSFSLYASSDWRRDPMSEFPEIEELEAKINARFKELQSRTHPGVALLVSGYIDDFLQDLLLHKMRPLSNAIKDRLFKGYGPLESFSARIDIAYAFQVVDDKTYENMRAIKDVRNKFAHPTEELNFNSPIIREICKRFSTFDIEKGALRAFTDAISETLHTLQQQFTITDYARGLLDFLEPDQEKPSPDKSGK